MRKGLSPIGKLLGTLAWPGAEMLKALGRLDSYDPFAHSIALFHRDPAILTHELGHAQDFAARRWRTLYIIARAFPPVLFYQEWKASTFGIENLRQRGLDAHIKRANRVLGGGFGSYTGSVFDTMAILPGALVGQAIGAIFNPFGRPYRSAESKPKGHTLCGFAIVFLGLSAIAFFGSVLGGHSRDPYVDAFLENRNAVNASAAIGYMIGANCFTVVAIILSLIAWLRKRNRDGKIILRWCIGLFVVICIRQFLSLS